MLGYDWFRAKFLVQSETMRWRSFAWDYRAKDLLFVYCIWTWNPSSYLQRKRLCIGGGHRERQPGKSGIISDFNKVLSKVTPSLPWTAELGRWKILFLIKPIELGFSSICHWRNDHWYSVQSPEEVCSFKHEKVGDFSLLYKETERHTSHPQFKLI